MSASEAWEFTLASGVLVLAFICLAPSRWNFCRDVGVTVLVILTIVYARQRFIALDPFDANQGRSWWQWSFAMTEGIALVYELWSYWILRRMSDHSGLADEAEWRFRQLSAKDIPGIAILIPTFSEPPELVRRTLQAARDLPYAGQLTVYCLDDGRHRKHAPGQHAAREAARLRSEQLEDICRELQVEYVARRTSHRAKAGNLQFAFRRTTEEIIVVLDSDFQVDPARFLPRTIGLLLSNPKIGLVQVPQCFVNPDPIGHNLCAPRAICDSQTAFMRVVQAGRDYHGNAFCVGSGWVARREALDAIDGFKRLTTVAEDLELSYHLRLVGYETCYLNEALAFGLAPESLPEFLGQQTRWCCGSLQQLDLPTGPIRGRHRLIDRLFYLDPPLFWLTHLSTIQVLLAPLLFWYLGIDTIPDSNNLVLAALLPRLLIRGLLLFWLTHQIVLPFFAALPKTLASFHVTLALARWAFLDTRSAFRVTSKNGSRTRIEARWPLFFLFSGIASLILTGMILSEFGGLPTATMLTTPLNYAWSVSGVMLSFLAALACIELPVAVPATSSLESVQKGNMLQAVCGVVHRSFSLD